MKKRLLALALSAALLLLLGGCASQTADPLLKNEATDVPGLAMSLPPASAGTNDASIANVTLYYRYLDEPMLAGESRTLTVPRDESIEFAIVQALVEGPSAGHSDLRRLLPAATLVESVVSRGDTLFVTFNNGFLNDDVPEKWSDDSKWRTEAPLLRKLIVQSIVASVTDYQPYTGVQILVHKADEAQTSLRLDNVYFLTGTTGLSEPISRDETLLLTAENTAGVLLIAWQEHDYERLYSYVTNEGKPSQAAFTEELSHAQAIKDFSTSGGSVSTDGIKAVVTVSIKRPSMNGAVSTVIYPMPLIRDNCVWKMTYANLISMMEQ